MLTLTLCALLASAPLASVELRAEPLELDEEVTLEVSGMSAPRCAEAGLFLFGKLATPARSLRALLLRSTDGGAHWTEVLPVEEDSEVLFVDFTGCEGRALVGWSTEGPGELTLYASKDQGATWTRRGLLPKSVWSEWPVHMAWKDGRRGTVWLQDLNAEDTPPPRALATGDGGRTWRAVKQRLPKSRLRQPVAPELLRRLPTRWRVEAGRLVPGE